MYIFFYFTVFSRRSRELINSPLYIACTISPIQKPSVYLRRIGVVFYDAIKKLKEIREKVCRNLLLFLRVGREQDLEGFDYYLLDCTISPIQKSSLYLQDIGLVFYDAIKNLKAIREKVYPNLLLFLRMGRE
jgi:hypothetical protein